LQFLKANCEPLYLRRLSACFRAFECDEWSSRHLLDSQTTRPDCRTHGIDIAAGQLYSPAPSADRARKAGALSEFRSRRFRSTVDE
jgi:hypothetical protein